MQLKELMERRKRFLAAAVVLLGVISIGCRHWAMYLQNSSVTDTNIRKFLFLGLCAFAWFERHDWLKGLRGFISRRGLSGKEHEEYEVYEVCDVEPLPRWVVVTVPAALIFLFGAYSLYLYDGEGFSDNYGISAMCVLVNLLFLMASSERAPLDGWRDLLIAAAGSCVILYTAYMFRGLAVGIEVITSVIISDFIFLPKKDFHGALKCILPGILGCVIFTALIGRGAVQSLWYEICGDRDAYYMPEGCMFNLIAKAGWGYKAVFAGLTAVNLAALAVVVSFSQIATDRSRSLRLAAAVYFLAIYLDVMDAMLQQPAPYIPDPSGSYAAYFFTAFLINAIARADVTWEQAGKKRSGLDKLPRRRAEEDGGEEYILIDMIRYKRHDYALFLPAGGGEDTRIGVYELYDPEDDGEEEETLGSYEPIADEDLESGVLNRYIRWSWLI